MCSTWFVVKVSYDLNRTQQRKTFTGVFNSWTGPFTAWGHHEVKISIDMSNKNALSNMSKPKMNYSFCFNREEFRFRTMNVNVWLFTLSTGCKTIIYLCTCIFFYSTPIFGMCYVLIHAGLRRSSGWIEIVWSLILQWIITTAIGPLQLVLWSGPDLGF